MGSKPAWQGSQSFSVSLGQSSTTNLNTSTYVRNPRNKTLAFSRTGSANDTASSSITVTSAGVLTTPSSLSVASYQFEVQWTDGTTTAARIFTLSVVTTNQPVAWTDTLGDTFTPTAAQAFSYTFTATDPDGDPISFTSSAPAGFTVTQLPQAGTTRQITVAGDTSLTAGTPYTVTLDATSGSVVATLTLSGGASGKPWTFGHTFKKGDIPSGQSIVAAGTGGPASFQADIRNRWSDGSAKYAVLSGVGGTSVTLSASSAAAPTGEVALSASPASVTFTGVVNATYTCPNANTASAWNKATSHLVRKISGPVMTERHYYVPTTDNHLAVWFFVRSYSTGDTEVETVVENGWWNVATPTVKTYTATVTVGGTTRYSGSLNHYHHTRWSRVDWVGTAPGITPVHDGSYLRSTKIVPNLIFSGASTAALTFAASTENQVPFAPGDFGTGDLNATGENPYIGPVTYWDSHWVASQDSRATVAVLGNARNQGRYSIYYRDETTGRPVKPRSYSLYYYTNNAWASQSPNLVGVPGSVALPNPTGGNNPGLYETAHQFAPALCAYLISGRWSFLESTQMQASADAFDSGSSSSPPRGANFQVSVASGQPRATAWNTRARMLAALISPTTIEPTMQAEYAAITQANIQGTYTYWTVTRGNPPTGLVASRPDYADTKYTGGYYNDAAWQQHYNDIVHGWTVLCEPENVDLPSALQLALYAAQHPVGLTGTNATWNYRDVTYTVPYGLGTDPLTTSWRTWAQAYQAWLPDPGDDVNGVPVPPQSAIPDTDGLSILYGRVEQSGWPYNFPTITLAAITTAVNVGASGAAAGYARFTGSSTYQAAASIQKLKDDPRWGFGAY